MSTINTGVNIKERPAKTAPAGVAVLVILLSIAFLLGGLGLIIVGMFSTWTLAATGVVLFLLGLPGWGMVSILEPGEAMVTSFFGNYTGTIRRTGLVATLPFLGKVHVSVRDQNFETPVSKVNDANGNPINVSAIVVWRLADTAKATYAVEAYGSYLETQAESAVRHVVASHPYDSGVSTPEDVVAGAEPSADQKKVSLLGGAETVNKELSEEITARTLAAGVEILEVRINNLAYSVEIAQAMLQRQQAAAVVDARKIIVEGAVGIVENAITELDAKIPGGTLDQGALASNLLVVLVGESKVAPVVDVSSKKK